MAKCVYFIIFSFSIFSTTFSIADNAAYYVQNVQDKLCITAGPVSDSDSLSLFKHGIPISSNCTFTPSQEWVLALTRKGRKGKGAFYEMRSFNNKIYDKSLTAVIKGEFITYFPQAIKFAPVKSPQSVPVPEPRQSLLYKIYEKVTNKCLESRGENHVIHRNECDMNNPAQEWELKLVNQPDSQKGKVPCNTFWPCHQ